MGNLHMGKISSRSSAAQVRELDRQGIDGSAEHLCFFYPNSLWLKLASNVKFAEGGKKKAAVIDYGSDKGLPKYWRNKALTCALLVSKVHIMQNI